MTILDIIKKRRSVRCFKDKPVEKKKIKILLESARWAPSWANKQCWRFIVVEDKDLLKKLIEIQSEWNRRWLLNINLIFVICADPSLSGYCNNQSYYLVDASIAAEHIALTATELGLGSCWVGGGIDEAKVKSILKIPPEIRVVALLPIGYPGKCVDPKIEAVGKKFHSNRKPIEEIAYLNIYGNSYK
jgi:nitroreductase